MYFIKNKSFFKNIVYIFVLIKKITLGDDGFKENNELSTIRLNELLKCKSAVEIWIY
jgi:hypothetical protein